jgi:macrolide transport system ATP-binding/permease protein
MSIRSLADQLRQDLAYALRTMSANPLFASMAVLSLALGIGANTAIYSFMEAILMRSLPVQDPGSLVVFKYHTKAWPAVAHSFSGNNSKDPKRGLISGNLPYPAFEVLRDRNSVCSTVFGFTNGLFNLVAQGQADRARGIWVTGAYFRGFGVAPAAGRMLDDNDDRAGAPVVVLSYSYAEKHFGGVAQAVGKSILVNNQPFTTVGVLPPSFNGADSTWKQEIFLPLHAAALLNTDPRADPQRRYLDGNRYWIEVMGRLKPGVSRAQAQEQLRGIFQPFIESTASNDKERSDLPVFYLEPGAAGLDQFRRRYSEPLYVLMTMVGLILAIACANIANLLLARATTRSREIAVRLSLGAGRGRVIRQLLTESLFLAGLGGALGLVFAQQGIRVLTVLLTNGDPSFNLHATLNWNVLAVTLAISLGTGLLFGLAPALQTTRVDLVSTLKQSRTVGAIKTLRRPLLRFSLSHALVAGQIGISLLLLVAAGLFVRTLSNLDAVKLGFNREHVLLFSVNARQAGYREQALVRFYQNLCEKLRAVPGVRSATLSSYQLASGSVSKSKVVGPAATTGDQDSALISVGSSFLATMQIPLLLGREFEDRDQAGDPRIAIVNDVFARKFFGDTNPIGKRIGFDQKKGADLEIIGVAKASRHQDVKNEIPPVVYMPFALEPADLYGMTYEVRTAGDPLALAETARRLVHDADSRLPVSDIATQAGTIDGTLVESRTFATLCSWFALLAVTIACVGLYGTMAYSVARRTNEIGLRMALGARQGRLLWMVMREVMLRALAGLALGLPVAYLLSSLVETYLFGLKAHDPLVLAGAPLVLVAAALIAGYGPAWRASRIDPWVALRNE